MFTGRVCTSTFGCLTEGSATGAVVAAEYSRQFLALSGQPWPYRVERNFVDDTAVLVFNFFCVSSTAAATSSARCVARIRNFESVHFFAGLRSIGEEARNAASRRSLAANVPMAEFKWKGIDATRWCKNWNIRESSDSPGETARASYWELFAR